MSDSGDECRHILAYCDECGEAISNQETLVQELKDEVFNLKGDNFVMTEKLKEIRSILLTTGYPRDVGMKIAKALQEDWITKL